MKQRNVVKAIQDSLSELRRSELKVAEYVLAHAADVIHMRIVDLAQEAHVSEPTVVRFCRAIGCDGFQDFKLSLAQYVANTPTLDDFTLCDSDSAQQYTFKVFDNIVETLSQVRNSLDPRVIEQAVEAITRARRLEFYGFGASQAVTIDAQHKFFRLQISTAAYSDPHLQAMAAMGLGRNDVVVAISQSGRSQALLDAMHLVREAGATLIGLAPRSTPVSLSADIPIYIDAEEDAHTYTPLPSRIAHMAVIDILAVGVAKAKGPQVTEHLQKLERGLQSLRTRQRSLEDLLI